jgi:hypothetical protein
MMTDQELRTMTERFIELNRAVSFEAARQFLHQVAARHPEAPFLIRKDIEVFFNGRHPSLVMVCQGAVDNYVNNITQLPHD